MKHDEFEVKKRNYNKYLQAGELINHYSFQVQSRGLRKYWIAPVKSSMHQLLSVVSAVTLPNVAMRGYPD